MRTAATEDRQLKIPVKRSGEDRMPHRVRMRCLRADGIELNQPFIRGFSTIPDGQMLDFANVVLGGLASIVADYNKAVEYKETAGDSIYLVLTDVTVAAACALRFLDRMSQVSTGAFSRLGIRISAHIGTALAATDPVTGFRRFFGSEVIRAARMEPITPVGECYVTEQFAGVLALECSGQYLCEYAGTLESANGFGAFRMYSLRRLSRG